MAFAELTTCRQRRVGVLALLLATGAILAGCGSADEVAAPTPGTESFLEDLAATLVLPADISGELPLVVLVPGGGWFSADLEGFPELADELAASGAAVVTMTYRTSDSGEYFPVPVEDVACGLGYAVETVEGLDVSTIVLGGHSSGANMAALVALAPEVFESADCPYEPATPDALIGISGPYDITQAFPAVAEAFFGPDRTDTSTWDEGNPMTYAGERPDLPALLVHGMADDMVPVTFTVKFDAALVDGGHDVTADYPEGADHFSVLAPDVAGAVIADWLGLS
jgi:acetyl esterase/lipase